VACLADPPVLVLLVVALLVSFALVVVVSLARLAVLLPPSTPTEPINCSRR
jgi:hypothetical protein